LETAARAVLFADVSDSTRIYEALGDTHALSVISHLFRLLETCVARHSGAVVKTIGNAMVCSFPEPDAAMRAACEMMAALAPLPARPYGKLLIKVGITYGQVVIAEGEIFGDTVNVCARLVALANAEQVMTSRETADALSPNLRVLCRTLFPVPVKGRCSEVVACEVLWRSDPDITEFIPGRDGNAVPGELWLKLSHAGNTFVVDDAALSARLGRDGANDVVVTSHFSSRFHARIHKREGRFVLSDLSTNGTYLLADDGANEVLLQREEAVLGERGWIGLGMSAARHGDHVVRYRIEHEGD
jgi:class 3 adenylate cyclase